MSTQQQRYTCVSKPGDYELVGTSSGAGTLKGLPVIVYRDVTTGRLFHREPENFMARMKKIQAEPAINHELLAALEEIADAFSPMPNPKEWHRADIHQRTLDLARSAIAKAKGGAA